jgi:hypothetical protein
LQKRKQKLAAKKQRWELKKQKLRESLQASKRALAEQSRLLSLTSEQLACELPLGYDSEWQNAERRIAEQNTLLQQAESNYEPSLTEKRLTLTNAFNALKKSLSERQLQAPLTLTQLQQQNAQRRTDLPALVATWKAAAAVRETRCNDDLTRWFTSHPISSGDVPSQEVLTSRQLLVSKRKQALTSRKQTLSEKKRALQQRKQQLSSVEQAMLTEWQRVSTKPSLSTPPSAGQRQDWLKKSLPLRAIWRELLPLMKRCALLKAELLTGGFLSAEEYPEIDVAWAAVEFH